MFKLRDLFKKLLPQKPRVPVNDTERIYAITQMYENTCINIGDFVEFLKPDWAFKMDPVTNRKILETGLYCTVHGKKLWVSKIVGPGNVRVSNDRITHASDDEALWSPEVPLMFYNTIERALKIKAFW